MSDAMTTTTDLPAGFVIPEAQQEAAPVAPAATPSAIEFGKKLQEQTSGCALHTYALSRRRTMSRGALNQVAGMFEAETDSIGGSREIISRKHEFVKPVYMLLDRAKDLVRTYTIDYPEKGVRLIKIDRIELVVGKINEIRDELNKALLALRDNWQSVKDDAKNRLGNLYNEGDYPLDPTVGYGVELTFPAIKPDDRLAQLHPELFKQEQERIAARFADAVKQAEAVAADELTKMLDHLIERLTPADGGSKKTLHETTVTNLVDFAKRFKDMSVGSNADLEALVAEVEKAASGIDVKTLRKSDGGAIGKIKEKVQGLRAKMDELVIARPIRELDLD